MQCKISFGPAGEPAPRSIEGFALEHEGGPALAHVPVAAFAGTACIGRGCSCIAAAADRREAAPAKAACPAGHG